MKRLVRIVPVGGFNLFDAMQSEVARLTARGQAVAAKVDAFRFSDACCCRSCEVLHRGV